jgi:hypothetical protein
VKWLRRMLARFGLARVEPDPLIERSEHVAEAMKDLTGEVRITAKNRRAHEALRRLDSHARR